MTARGSSYLGLISWADPEARGGIRTNAFAFVAVGLSTLLLLPGTAVSAASDLTEVTVAFTMPARDVIAGVASFRAQCDIAASGEALQLLANESVRTTVAATPGACEMILNLLGFDVTIPTINTTPLGRSSVYIPGLSVVTLGVVDLSIDLMTAMNSTSRVADGAVAAVEPLELAWITWGAQRLNVHAAGGYGSVAASELNTTFTYGLSLGLTVSALGVTLYHTDLVDLGRYAGQPSLVTSVRVDLFPPPLTLGAPTQLTSTGAVFSWTCTVEDDMDHLELWVTDGTLNVSYRIEDPHALRLAVPLKADTNYRAWILVVDLSGQSSSSSVVSFRTAATTPVAPQPPTDVVSQANGVLVGTVAAAAAFLVFIAFLLGEIRGRRKT